MRIAWRAANELSKVSAESFVTVPVGIMPATSGMIEYVQHLMRAMIELALEIVGPIVGLVLLAQIALGLLGRMSPRLSTFMLSFPIIYAIALTASGLMLKMIWRSSANPIFILPISRHG